MTEALQWAPAFGLIAVIWSPVALVLGGVHTLVQYWLEQGGLHRL